LSIKRDLSEARHTRVGGRSGRTVTGLAHGATVSALTPGGSRDDERETTVEAANPTTMTSDLSVALAQVVRSQPAGWTKRSEGDA
jgi:hypothetical protein